MANEFVIRAKIDTNPAKMQLNALKNEIAQKVREINKKEIRLGDIKTGKYLTDEMKTAKKELEYLAKEYVKKVDEINKKEIRLGGLKKGTVLTDETKEAKKQLDALKKEYDKKESELAKKRENLSNLNSGKSSTYEIKEAKSQLSALEKVYDKKLSDIAKKESRLSDLQKGITLSDGTKEAKRQLEALKKEYNKKADEISKKKIQLGDIQAGKTLTDGIKSAQKEVSVYEKNVEAAAKNVADLQKKYDKKASEKIPTGEMIAKDSTIRGEQGNLKRALTSIESLKARALEKGQLFSDKQIDEQIDRIVKAQEEGLGELAQTYLERLKEMEEANNRFYSSDDFTNLQKRAEVYTRAVQNAKEEKEALIKAGQGYTSGAETEEAKEIEAELSSAKEKYDELVQDLNIARAGVDKANSVAVNSLRDEITQSSGELVRLQEQINSAEQGVGRATSTAISSVSDEIAQDKRELDGIGIKVDEARQKVDSTTSKAASAVSDEIKKGEEELSKLEDEIKETERTADDSTANAISDLSDEIRNDKDELVESQKALNEAANHLDNATANAINSVSTEISKDKEELQSLQAEMSNVGRTLNSSLSFNNFVTGVAQVGTYVRSIAGSIWNMGTSVFSWVGKTAVSAVRTLFNGFTSLGSSVLDFGMKAASVFGGWLIDGISKVKDLTIGLGKAFLKVSEHLLGISMIKNVWGAVTGLFQRIMRLASLAFVFRVMTQWFRQLKNDVVDAFKTYLNYDSALNTSVNNLKNSFSTLKSQLASAFAPIVEIIVPYLTTFVNWCVTAANALSALIAALTGKTSWKKAVVNSTGAVSKGADNAADSLDNAADKAEELKEKLGAYDKLNVIQDDNDKKKSGSGNKGGGAGGSGNGGNGISYVDQEIGDKIKGLADWLKDMWNKADLTELGRKLGEMLRDSLKKIPWDKIQDEAKKTAKRICTLIAGFVTTPGLAKELGKAIGELINTGIIFANTMVHEFPWTETGQFLADGLNEAIKTIDFHMAGDTIATGLNGIMDLLNTFLDPKTGLDFSQLGKKIADFINTATTLDWQKLGTLATNLGTDIATFVNELSAAEVLIHIGTLIGNFIEAAVSAFKTFVDNTDFKSLGSDVGGFVKAIGDSISDGLKLLSEIDVAGKLNDFIDGFKAKVKPEDLKTWGSSLGAALGNVISGLATAIYDNREYVYEAASSFVSGLVSGAGAAITEEDFGHVGATLSYWLSNAINDIGLWLQDENNQKEIKSDLKSFFNNLASNWNKGTLGNLGAGIKRGLGTIGSTVSEYIDEHGQDIKDEVIDFFEHLLGNGDGTLDSEDFKELGQKINTLFNSIKEKITTWIDDPNGGQAVIDSTATLFDNLIGNGDGALTFSDVWNFISEVFSWLNQSARQLFKSEDFLGSLAGFIFLVKTGLLGKFFDIGGGVAKKFLGGIVEGLGKKAVVDKISGAVSETELTTLGTSWGTLLGNSFGAAAALVIGILITDALAGMAGEAWNDSINEKGKKGLTAGQTKIYDLATISGLREGNNIKDKESVTALHDFLETLGTKDFNVSGLSTLVDNTNLSLDQFVSRLKLIQDQEDLTAQEQEDLNSIIEAAQGIIDYTRNKVTDFDGDLESLESTSKGVTFTDLNTALEDLYNSGQISEAEFKLLQGNLKELEKDNDGPAAFQRIIDKIVELKGEDAARYFAGDIKNSILAVRDALSQVDVSKLKDSLDKLNGSWDEEVVNAYLGRISEFQDSGDIDLMAASFGELLGYLKDNGASAKDLAGILENTLGIKIDGTRSSVEKAKEALSALGIPDDVKTSLFNTLDSLVTKEDKVTEKSPKVKPEVDDTEANKKTDDFYNKVAAFGQLSAKSKLEVDTSEEEASVAKAEGDLNTYKDSDYTANLKADSSDLEGMLQAGILKIEDFKDKNGVVTVEVGADTNKVTYDIDLADKDIQAVLEKYRNGSQDPTIAIKADDSQAQEVISTDEADWALFEEDDIVKTVKVEDQASEPINSIKENTDSIQDEKSINFVDLNSSGALMAILLGSIFSLIVNSIPDEKTVKLSIENNTEEPIKTIKQSLSSIADHVDGEVKSKIASAFREAFNTVRSDAASYMTGGQSVISAMFNMVVDAKTKLNDLQSAFNSTFSAIVQTVSTYVSSISQSIRGIPNKEVDVKVDDGGSTQNVIDIIDRIPTEHYVTVYANWVGEYSKTFYATVEWSNVSYTALGGIFNNGFWSKIPQYAGGTANAHGSLFLAGEAGPEVVGHVNGRTEVLNKSQIAAAIYMAVRAAMGEYFLAAMSAVIQTIVNSANSINTNLGYLKDQYQLNNAYLNEISVAGLSDVGALKSYYNNVISTSSNTNLDSLADRVASRLSGNININNETYLDGSLIYNRMVEIDRQTLKMTGQSGFGGR